MFGLFPTISLICISTTVFAITEIVLEDEYFETAQCVSNEIPMLHWPFFERDDNDLILNAPDTALTFNVALDKDELNIEFDFPKVPGCEQKLDNTLYLIEKTSGQPRTVKLVTVSYSFNSVYDQQFLEVNGQFSFIASLKCAFSSNSAKCADKEDSNIPINIAGNFELFKKGLLTQAVLKYDSSPCPIKVRIKDAKLIDRPDIMQRVVTTTPTTLKTTTATSTEAVTTTTTEIPITEEQETTESAKVKSASSVNKVIIAIFSVVGILLLLMACGVGVYFVYTRFCKKKKAPIPFIPSSRSMPVTLSKTITVKTEPSKQKTAEVVMNPKDEDKTQSLSMRPLDKVAISPAIRTETQVSSVPTPAAEPTQSSVVADKSVIAVKTAIPKTEKEVSKTVDVPPLVIEKGDNYTKIKQADFERGKEDSMASEEGCGPNIHKLEPLVMVPMTVADPSLEQYPAEYVEKMALRKATIADRAALHLQAVAIASNYLLKKGFKNNGTTLTGSDQLMEWLKTKSAFVQFVAECVEVRPDVTSSEFNASKIQWRRYLKKIDLVETYRQSCWIGQSSERREFFLLATFFKLEQLAQQYSDEDLKMYPFPVPYLLEVRTEAPQFFKIEDAGKQPS